MQSLDERDTPITEEELELPEFMMFLTTCKEISSAAMDETTRSTSSCSFGRTEERQRRTGSQS
jgi:hypothetical protein